MDAGADVGQPDGAVQDATTSCTGCEIDGVCVPDGTRNPDNDCEVCHRATAATDWSSNDGASCDDGLFCTIDDVCSGTTCGGTARACGDGIDCNGAETCDETTQACLPAEPTCPGSTICDLATDACVVTCTGCVIGGVCYADGSRNPANACEVCAVGSSATAWTPNDGAACDDGAFCTTGDTCSGGACAGSSVLNFCDDGVDCNGSEVCNDATDRCDAGATACSSGTVCDTGLDMCVTTCTGCVIGGVCQAPGAINPTNPCLGCDIATSTTAWTARTGATCDDGLYCTQGETCSAAAVCAGGTARDCTDGVACNGTETCNETTDRCDVGTSTCTGGQLCNVMTDSCALSCVGGTTLCSGMCTNTAIDPNNCNGCGMACPAAANATPVCAASNCAFVCDAGFRDCTASPGCETDVLNNAAHCGGCNLACAGSCVMGVCITSQTFSYTGGVQTFVVPAGVTSIHVTAFGAAGGCNLGGLGGRAEADVPVTPGETLNIYVGGQGACSAAGMLPGGFNGGGAKYTTSGDFWEGGSGGGASDVRRGGVALTNRVIVAGGGGGRGWGGQAGAGGGLTGENGNPAGGGCDSFCAGAGGTQMSGGAGGDCNAGNCVGLPGVLGVGGRGTGCAASGGGGGGGYYGGGGGGHCSAGGGSSRADFPGNSSASTMSGVRSGHGEIVIAY